MSIGIVQTKHAALNSGDATTVAITLDAPVTVGQYIDIFVTWGTSTGASPEGISACADNLGGGTPNVYTPVTACALLDTGNDQESGRITCPVTQAGTPTITVTFLGTRNYRGLTVNVVGEAASIDTGAINAQYQAGTTTPSSGSVTPDTNGSLLLATTMGSNLGANTITIAGGWTTASNTGGTDACAAEYIVQGTAASIAGTFTCSSDNMHTAVITYRPSGGGGGPAVPALLPSSGLGGGMAMRKGGLR